MTTQAIVANFWGLQGGYAFSDTSTDAAESGNRLLDITNSKELGEKLEGYPIDHVSVEYAGGVCAWKVMRNGKILAYGFGYLANQAGALHKLSRELNGVSSFTVQRGDVAEVFCDAV